jgi:hypothetical protein
VLAHISCHEDALMKNISFFTPAALDRGYVSLASPSIPSLLGLSTEICCSRFCSFSAKKRPKFPPAGKAKRVGGEEGPPSAGLDKKQQSCHRVAEIIQ